MNQPLLEGIQDEVIDENLVQVAFKTTTVYDKALDYFKQTQTVLLIYSVAKLVVALLLIILNNTLEACQLNNDENQAWGQEYLEIWVALIIVHGFFAFTCYYSLIKFVKNEEQNRQVATALGHAIEIEVPNNLTNEDVIQTFIQEEFETQNQAIMDRLNMEGPLEESRKISLMSVEIKKKVQEFCWYGKYIGKGCFILFQTLEIWGLVYYFSNYSIIISGCDDMYIKFLFVILFLGLYQYLDIYIMAVLIIVFMPLLLCYSLYEWLKEYLRRRRERRRIDDVLNVTMYVEGITKGSSECAICMQNYLKGEKVDILPCSDKHHFHSECIRSWFAVNTKCPICRNSIMEPNFQ